MSVRVARFHSRNRPEGSSPTKLTGGKMDLGDPIREIEVVPAEEPVPDPVEVPLEDPEGVPA